MASGYGNSVKEFLQNYWYMIWAAFFTLTCLPVVLIANVVPGIRQTYMAINFSIIGEYLMGINEERKRQMFAQLKDMLMMKRKKADDKGTPLKIRVLEIGPGNGANFPFYPRDHQLEIKLTTLDRNAVFRMSAARAVERQRIIVEEKIAGNAEDMHMIPDESFDVVIATHVICCTDIVPRFLKEVHRVLKKVRE